MRQILRFQASQNNRHISETWLMTQLGLGCALLVTAIFTGHRSRIVIVGSALMTLIVAILYLYLTPIMNALARSYDFLPAAAAVQERENFDHFSVWYRVLEIFKNGLGALVTARLLLDRNDLQETLLPAAAPKSHHRRRHRRLPLVGAPAPSVAETEQTELPDGHSS